jgi:hypothetical protein
VLRTTFSPIDMKDAALGFRMHSGWGAVVAVSNDGVLEVNDRRHIALTESSTPGSKQPYHHVENFALPAAEEYLAKSSAISGRLAATAIREILVQLRSKGFGVKGSVILTASGRALPSLEKVLSSHALIHAAEGEFFRNIVFNACQEAGLYVTRLPEREVEERATNAFGRKANHVKLRISELGKLLGPPWTQDEKLAALAAALVLES